jgi:hypothetical protein
MQGTSSTTFCSTRELQLLRALLKRNSRRMQPTAWQHKHLPLGPDSHWLATFICPVYPEVLGDSATFMDAISNDLMKMARAAMGASGSSSSSSSSRAGGRSSAAAAAAGGCGTSGAQPPITARARAAVQAGVAAAAAAGPQASVESSCRVCGAVPGGRGAGGAVVQKLMRCSRCKSDKDRYCCVQCQRADWQRHKRATCSSTQEAPESQAPHQHAHALCVVGHERG